MDYLYISTAEQLEEFCDAIASQSTLAFDTEFVSEDTYRPDLCLIQVASAHHLAVIDPKEVDATPFWELIGLPGRQTIVHAGREEIRFCLRAIGRRPSELFDVQLAAGLIGLEYPAAYSTLVHKLISKSLRKGETRTDWRRRPLSRRQIEYALQDVVHLTPLRDRLMSDLQNRNRYEWLQIEVEAWQDDIELAERHGSFWRVSGISGLRPRSLAIVRELWRWREQEAERRDRPPRRVLRDDLIVELARRQSAELNRIHAVRGMERRDLRKHHQELAECIRRGIELPDDQCPTPQSRSSKPQLSLLSQFMTTALHSICRSARVAPGLVGAAQDVRELIAYLLKLDGADVDDPPSLARGWRAEVVGHQIEKLLRGELSIRIGKPLSDQPLIFQPQEKQD